MAEDRCKNCRGPLSAQSTCYRLQCIPKERVRVGGKGSGPGNLNARSRERKIRRMCPLCADSNSGRGCWQSACSNGPVAGGMRRACDCHRTFQMPTVLGTRSLHAPLRGRSFSQWDMPRPAL